MRSIDMHIVNPTQIVSTKNWISLQSMYRHLYTYMCRGTRAHLCGTGGAKEKENPRGMETRSSGWQRALKTIVDKQSRSDSDKKSRVGKFTAICAAEVSIRDIAMRASLQSEREEERGGEGEREREKMRPQHGETLRRLRSQVTSLANRAARSLPDTQSRLGARADRMYCSLVALRTNLPSRKLTPARSTSRDRSLARFSLAEEDLRSASRAPG